jgi:plastocyanin
MRRIIGIVALAGVGVAGCGGSDSTSDAAPSDAAPSASAPAAKSAEKAVSIETFQFAPKALTVAVGDTVVWKNGDSILHTVTSGTRTYDPGDSGKVTASAKDGRFDMELADKGTSASHTFKEAGTFHYFCDRHPGMEADVTVR